MEASESPTVPDNDTSICSGELSIAFASSHGAFMIPWNTSAGVQ